jgi:signal transduction histidine kinase
VLLVLKESLTNILRHAAASEVKVRIDCDGPNLQLTIQDNGRGFELGTLAGGGNGLGNMRKRVRNLGGEFRVTSAPGQGTRVEASVPLANLESPVCGSIHEANER